MYLLAIHHTRPVITMFCRKIEENLQDVLMLKFLDQSQQKMEDWGENSTNPAPNISQMKSEQARVKKNIRELKRKNRKTVQVKQDEILSGPVSTEISLLAPVEEDKNVIEDELLPVTTDAELGSLPPPPPPRDLNGISFAENAALYESVFMMAESRLINVDEEAKIYKLIASSNPTVLESYRSFQIHKDLGLFASELTAI